MVQANPDIPYHYPIWLNPNFIWPPIGRNDLVLACITFGFFLGFGILTCRHAYSQLSMMRNPKRSVYAWMIWGEILANIIIALVTFLLLLGTIMPSFSFWFGILFVWVFQVQLILQIMCNRCSVVEVDRNRARWVKIVTFILVTLINISVFCIWVPANMQISQTYMHINNIWDRITKVLLLLIDLALNIYFILSVKSKLVKNGLEKYDRLVRFNIRIIIISISLDVVLVGTMSLNGLVYGLVQATMYIIKLNIELSLSALIILIAKERDVDVWLDEAEMAQDLRRPSCLGRATSRSLGFSSPNAGNASMSDHMDISEVTDTREGDAFIYSRARVVSLARPLMAYKRCEADDEHWCAPRTRMGRGARDGASRAKKVTIVHLLPISDVCALRSGY